MPGDLSLNREGHVRCDHGLNCYMEGIERKWKVTLQAQDPKDRQTGALGSGTGMDTHSCRALINEDSYCILG